MVARRRSSRRTSRWRTSRSTCSGQARALLDLRRASWRAPAGTRMTGLPARRARVPQLPLVEQQNGDFAVTMARQLLFSTYQFALYQALRPPTDPSWPRSPARRSRRSPTTAITPRLDPAARRRHRGSHRRMQAALDRIWPYARRALRYRRPADARRLPGVAARPGRPATGLATRYVDDRPRRCNPDQAGAGLALAGAAGAGLPHRAPAAPCSREMQHLHRSHPGATW